MNNTVTPAASFSPLSGDDAADIKQLFAHTPHTFGSDRRDLRQAPAQATRENNLTFSLRSVFPSNTP